MKGTPAIRFTLKQLAYFVAAAEQQSVTHAAQVLNVSQPSVSTAIAHLEEVLATQLFVRHHAQGLSLTPAGRHIFAEVRNLLAHAGELVFGAASADEPVQGRVDIGCFVTFAPYYVPPLLRELRQRHPDLQVRLHEGDAEFVQRGLMMGALDMAIVYDFGLGADFAHETLTQLPPYAVLAADHPLAAQSTVSLSALAAEPFVLLDLPLTREYFRSIFVRFGLEPKIRHRTTSYEMVRGLVANGHGVALLNLQLKGNRSYDRKPLAYRLLVEPAAPLEIVLAHATQVRPTRAAAAFADCTRDFFRKLHAKGAAGTAA